MCGADHACISFRGREEALGWAHSQELRGFQARLVAKMGLYNFLSSRTNGSISSDWPSLTRRIGDRWLISHQASTNSTTKYKLYPSEGGRGLYDLVELFSRGCFGICA